MGASCAEIHLEPVVFAIARWMRQAKLRIGVTSARGKTLAISLAESASDCFVSDRALAGTPVGATQGQVYNNPHPASYLALQTWVFVFDQRWHTRCRPLRNRRLLALCIDMQRGRPPPDGTRASKEADMTNRRRAGMTSPRRVLVSDSVDKSTASHMALASAQPR